MAATKDASLIERMGGAEAASGLLISAVEIFYTKLIADVQLARFFEGKDLTMLKRKQVDFLAYVFGGPTEYSGKGIFEAHEQLIREQGLNETHFDIVATHFQNTLTELGAAQELIDEAMRILGTARPIFVRANLAEDKSTSDYESSDGGTENISIVAGQLQSLLLNSDAELERTRHEVKHLVSRANPEKLQRLKAALRMRGPGLTDLLDQALEQ